VYFSQNFFIFIREWIEVGFDVPDGSVDVDGFSDSDGQKINLKAHAGNFCE
jgi:hypothetical protein